ncbi:MAG: uracil-DNA glycosylase [Calditrichaceae bacterium]
MDNVLNELNNLLDWYRHVYGDIKYLDGQLQDPPERSEQPIVMEPARVPEYKKSVKDVVVTHQKSPELEKFYLEIKDCSKCPLGETRKNFVFGTGNPKARIMFVGEAPGREEDEKGIPFVGKAGKLLDKMLDTIGLKRDDIYIANILKCRPPNNRDPHPDEVALCEPYLKRQLEMISPEILVALGRISAQVLLKRNDSLSKLRQDVQIYEDIPFVVTYHPAALLRNPQWKRNVWQDLKKIKTLMEKTA